MRLAPLHTWLPDAPCEAPRWFPRSSRGSLNCAFLTSCMHSGCTAAGLGSYARHADRLRAYLDGDRRGVRDRAGGLQAPLACRAWSTWASSRSASGSGAATFGAMLHVLGHSLTKAMLFLRGQHSRRLPDQDGAGCPRGDVADPGHRRSGSRGSSPSPTPRSWGPSRQIQSCVVRWSRSLHRRGAVPRAPRRRLRRHGGDYVARSAGVGPPVPAGSPRGKPLAILPPLALAAAMLVMGLIPAGLTRRSSAARMLGSDDPSTFGRIRTVAPPRWRPCRGSTRRHLQM
jgi:hypothetical protein